MRLDEDGNPTLWEDDVASAVLRSSFEDLRDIKLTQRTRPNVHPCQPLPPGSTALCAHRSLAGLMR